MRLSRTIGVALILSLLGGGPAGCRRAPRSPKVKKADPVWRNVVAAHTGGVVSRKSKVFVQFHSDLLAAHKEGQAARGLIETEPAIDGEPIVAGPRELVIVPKSELKPGSFYLVRVKGGPAAGLPDKAGHYEFAFQVLPRDFSVALEGLVHSRAEEGLWELRGTVTTTDLEEASGVEALLGASLEGEALPVRWAHADGSNVHGFAVSGIRKAAQARTLKLRWDGKAVASGRRETREVEVPGAGVFKVTEVRAVQGDAQHAAVYFSDAVSAEQNLDGLVRLAQGAATLRIEGNVLKVFPRSRLTGSATLIVEPSVRSLHGVLLGARREETLVFPGQKPRLRFVGKGVILPGDEMLSIPFETLNLRSVQVTALRVYAKNVGQFLQANQLDGEQELDRVGRFLWRKTIELPAGPPDQWQRHFFDAGELSRAEPGGLFRLTLSVNRSNAAYPNCTEEERRRPIVPEEPFKNHEELSGAQPGGWDGIEAYYNEGGSVSQWWREREDPCKDAYYRLAEGVRASRNFLASNIGLVAKRDRKGALHVVAADIDTGKPAPAVRVVAYNFQNQAVASGDTDGDGFLTLAPEGKPFYLGAEKGQGRGYLKLSEGAALPVSHFDVGGEQVRDGLKAQLYGERGVWRPGDEVHLVFVLEDKEGAVAAGHPATLRLYSPKGQLMETVTNSRPVGGFYRFTIKTREDAPTGAWTAKVQLGGSEFSKEVRVETVMPNRLKLELDFGGEAIYAADGPASAKLFAQWLHGARASGLKADVQAQLTPIPTRFTRLADHVYDDPTRELKSPAVAVFEGALDAEGRASFPVALEGGKAAAGALSAHFVTRVFEPSGAFSSSRETRVFHPYPRYVGLKLPKGDQARNMLLTDTPHKVSVATLGADGKPASVRRVQVKLYKIGWKWWWDKTGDSPAEFSSGEHATPIQEGVVATQEGRGEWSFEVKHPEWGRYLVRACDEEGGHCAGQVLYIDWPGWAGRAQEQGGPGAHMLLAQADKPEYAVGETATIQLPEGAEGQVLMSLENGSRVLSKRWVPVSPALARIELPITREMSPTVYVFLSLIQPHAGKRNDRPIRLYGVLPLAVRDPETLLAPVLGTAPEWKPESTATISVSEAKGRPMTYTLAVVDEGLLGLTAFQTPDLHGWFHRKEGLGVSTWDVYDSVIGDFGAELGRLLALGGAEDLGRAANASQARRFPPLVRMLGPFELAAKSTRTHAVDLPAYVGSVRAMVVAGRRGAYGRAEKNVFVRQPLMVQATLPRVIGPGEEMTVPVTAFALKEGLEEVSLTLQAPPPFEVVGPRRQSLRFQGPGEQLAYFQVRSLERSGKGTLKVGAAGGPHAAAAETLLTVRDPNPRTVVHVHAAIEPGKTWEHRVTPHGLPGTNDAALEVSVLPPMNLETRLQSLIRYPHGCAEQTTSAAFPQVYVPGLVNLSEAEKGQVERNVHAAIDRLKQFQAPSGGFVYWPGAPGEANAWVSNYVGHFLLEAERHGYEVPAAMRAQWVHFQKTRAQVWGPGGGSGALEQAYRLYTLALAGQPELGAMNRLRELPLSPQARWQLASAYHAAGVQEAAGTLAAAAAAAPASAPDEAYTYGSPLRDQAIILHGLALQGDIVRGKPAAEQVSAALFSGERYNTHALAYALMAMARFYGADKDGAKGFRYEVSHGPGGPALVASDKPVHRRGLAEVGAGGGLVRVRNPTDRRLFVTLAVGGVPKAGTEGDAAEGLELSVDYETPKGEPLDVARLEQGDEIVAKVTVANRTGARLADVALTHMAASGWELHNGRWTGSGDRVEEGLDYQDVRDDRVYSYFALGPGEAKTVRARFTAAYLGRFYLPAVGAEAMYDATKNARVRGRWVTVGKAG
ncbi:MAG: hypothetical protein HY554_10015 [Elusimicrobia bacterium]|nr:hypothetical protein [Elusimicrobiota bacterium]